MSQVRTLIGRDGEGMQTRLEAQQRFSELLKDD